MKKGFTTGSCAAVAAGAATRMLLSGKKLKNFEILTPAGTVYNPELLEIDMGEDFVSCAVKKDSGDDPDITNGILVFARAQLGGALDYNLEAGEGIGIITRPGLSRPVGDFAINNTPRKMIEEAVRNQMEQFDFEGPLTITIYVPQGAEIAAKTFNPNMGIEGGISILGTSGIVEPKSAKAFTDTVKLHLQMMKEEGMKAAVIVPGNYGMTFLGKEYDFPEEKIVPCGNFIGDAIDSAVKTGFDRILLVGHIGKLVKVSGGVMNTHSAEGDRRLEFLSEAFLSAAAELDMTVSSEVKGKLLSCVTTTAGLDVISETGSLALAKTSEILLDRILMHLKNRAGDGIRIECILYENNYGVLAKSEGADEIIHLSLH